MEDIFFSVDFETANQRRCSICEIGLLQFQDGSVSTILDTRIDPEEHFADMNISIHHIRPEHIIGKPKYHEIHEKIISNIGDSIIVSWTNFDKQCFVKVAQKYGLTIENVKWLDASIIARSVWPIYMDGFKLKDVAKDLDIEYVKHQAHGDALACGMVVKKALEISNTTIDQWFKKYGETIHIEKSTSKAQINNLKEVQESNPNNVIQIILIGLLITLVCCCLGYFLMSMNQ